jgi:plastocyanin
MRRISTLVALAIAVAMCATTSAKAQGNWPNLVEVVALDECDPTTFNAALGPDFCKNVALATIGGDATGFATLFDTLISEGPTGGDPNWDFEPDKVVMKKGATLEVVNQGGEPHTFTEVAQFGGGFLPPLNKTGDSTVPECAGGFSNVAVAKTRILQGSHLDITGLSKGKHLFECCIHPWMRMEVDVK